LSQAGLIDYIGGLPQVPTQFNADTGSAVPIGNELDILGDATQGSVTSASGMTVTITNSDATTSQKGVLETSTQAESIAGSSTSVSVTPDSLNAKLGDQTQWAIPYGNGSTNAIEWSSALTNGQLIIGDSTGAPQAATITAGSGVTIVNSAGGITISASTGSFSWNEETGTSANMSVQNGYIANNAALVTLTLPATASLGDVVQICGKGAGLFRIAQNAGQTIHYINTDTTTGVGGSLTAIEQYAALELVCITANTDWVVIDSSGNFTVV